MTSQKDTQARPGIKTFLQWVRDSHQSFRDNRIEQYIDAEMYDGRQWTSKQISTLREELGMYPLTINKTFSAVNLILGSRDLTKYDIIAKGRSAEDSKSVTSVASEALKFVQDQNGTEFVKGDIFKDGIVPGLGCMEVLQNSDPREETVKLAYRRWKHMWWDPYGTPWFDRDTTRYVYYQKWVDLEDLISAFPGKKGEINNAYSMTGDPDIYSAEAMYYDYDPDDDENNNFWLSMSWVDSKRKRLQPVQMWYTVWDKGLFATFADGRVIELTEKIPANEQYQIVMSSQEVLPAVVRRMRTATFIGNVLLEDRVSPHNHDHFPFATFCAYVDRFNRPFGVPRQIRDMDIETNKRRTTALAQLNKRRVIVEKDVVDDYNRLRSESIRPDGIVVVAEGKLGAIQIDDHQGDIRSNMALGQESEREIQEISGAVSELMGYETNTVSGKAKEKQQRAAATVIAPIFSNWKRFNIRLGVLAMSAIQQHWKQEKVIRITDTLQGADKILVFNQTIEDETGAMAVKNNITQGKYDIVISEAPISDTMREKFADVLIESTKRCAPEAVPMVIDIAFELMDMPKKDIILMRLRQAFGLPIMDTQDIDKEQIAKEIQEQKAKEAEREGKLKELEVEKESLSNEKLIAQIKRLLAQAALDEAQGDGVSTTKELELIRDSREEETHQKAMSEPEKKEGENGKTSKVSGKD